MRKKQEEKSKSGTAYKTKSKSSFHDDRMFVIGKDSSGNGKATIRLIPSYNKEQDDINTFVTRQYHSINTVKPGVDPKSAEKGDKRWREFLCPGEGCPVCAIKWDFYNEAKDEGLPKADCTAILKNWGEKQETFTNALIVKDPINEENRGKIMLFKLSNTLIGICDKEAERVNDVISSADNCNDAEEKAETLAEGAVDEGVTTFDAYDMVFNGKNINLFYRNQKDDKWEAPADYWGSSTLAPRFTSIIKIDKEGKTEEEIDDLIDEKAIEYVDKAYCLDEFTDPNNFEGAKKTIPSEEELENIIKWLKWETDDITGKKKKTKKVESKEEEPKANATKDRLLKKKKEVEKEPVKVVDTETVEETVEETVTTSVDETVETSNVEETAKTSSDILDGDVDDLFQDD